ncbi:MAG: DNA polymerase III subunit epsilon [Pseudomonadota bacterium]
MRQIILDTETTGLFVDQNHRIIEIGCIELINRKFTGKHFHYYLNPERAIDEGAQAIHGITTDFLANKPLFAHIAQELMDFLSGAELVIHNAPFDVGFINYELKLLNQAWQPLNEYCRIVDTLLMARQMHVGQRNNLDALCKRYSVDNSQREYHGALLDAHLLGRVYLAMTGGQATLFTETENVEIASQQQSVLEITQQKHKRKLPIILATEEELAAHELYLSHLAENGKCVWES